MTNEPTLWDERGGPPLPPDDLALFDVDRRTWPKVTELAPAPTLEAEREPAPAPAPEFGTHPDGTRCQHNGGPACPTCGFRLTPEDMRTMLDRMHDAATTAGITSATAANVETLTRVGAHAIGCSLYDLRPGEVRWLRAAATTEASDYSTGHAERGYFQRRYVAPPEGGERLGPVRAAGMHDGSRLHRMNVDPYDAACPCCYLGHPHTLAAHRLATT